MIDLRIIGTGNIGRRHLQAAAQLKEDINLSCHDIYEESLEATKQFIINNKLQFKKISYYNTQKEALENTTKDTIFIVATTAKGRAAILADIILQKPKAIIAEKPLTQNEEEYCRILKLAEKHQVKIYCNLSNHTYPGYKEVLKTIKEREHVICNINFNGTVGFACNGIHYLETISWLLQMKKYTITHSKLKAVFDSKRQGFQDFEGTMDFTINDQHQCTISIQGEQAMNTFQLITEKEIMTIFESEKKIVTIKNNTEVTQKEFPIYYTSQISNQVIAAILEGKKPDLPSIKEARLTHQLIFDFMKKHKIETINIT
jgi:predicted dehydrogenase